MQRSLDSQFAEPIVVITTITASTGSQVTAETTLTLGRQIAEPDGQPIDDRTAVLLKISN